MLEALAVHEGPLPTEAEADYGAAHGAGHNDDDEQNHGAGIMSRRHALLRDLADVAQRLSDDELQVMLTIGVRAWAGQTQYGCLNLLRDHRDFRNEAFEEACDAAFYLAAGLLTADGEARRRDRRNGLAQIPGGIAPVGPPRRRQRYVRGSPTFAASNTGSSTNSPRKRHA